MPDSNFIFFVATKKTKQKKAFALRLACLARYFGDINAESFIRQSRYRFPLLDEVLENLYYSGRPKREAS